MHTKATVAALLATVPALSRANPHPAIGGPQAFGWASDLICLEQACIDSCGCHQEGLTGFLFHLSSLQCQDDAAPAGKSVNHKKRQWTAEHGRLEKRSEKKKGKEPEEEKEAGEEKKDEEPKEEKEGEGEEHEHESDAEEHGEKKAHKKEHKGAKKHKKAKHHAEAHEEESPASHKLKHLASIAAARRAKKEEIARKRKEAKEKKEGKEPAPPAKKEEKKPAEPKKETAVETEGVHKKAADAGQQMIVMIKKVMAIIVPKGQLPANKKKEGEEMGAKDSFIKNITKQIAEHEKSHVDTAEEKAALEAVKQAEGLDVKTPISSYAVTSADDVKAKKALARAKAKKRSKKARETGTRRSKKAKKARKDGKETKPTPTPEESKEKIEKWNKDRDDVAVKQKNEAKKDITTPAGKAMNEKPHADDSKSESEKVKKHKSDDDEATGNGDEISEHKHKHHHHHDDDELDTEATDLSSTDPELDADSPSDSRSKSRSSHGKLTKRSPEDEDEMSDGDPDDILSWGKKLVKRSRRHHHDASADETESSHKEPLDGVDDIVKHELDIDEDVTPESDHQSHHGHHSHDEEADTGEGGAEISGSHKHKKTHLDAAQKEEAEAEAEAAQKHHHSQKALKEESAGSSATSPAALPKKCSAACSCARRSRFLFNGVICKKESEAADCKDPNFPTCASVDPTKNLWSCRTK